MARFLPGFVVLIGVSGHVHLFAQTSYAPSPVAASAISAAATAIPAVAAPPAAATVASTLAGRLVGVVTDERGRRLGGASVLALGRTLVAAKSDSLGRFALSLPNGDYVLRAVRDGYVSTYREPVRVQANATIERHITLVRDAGASTPGQTADPAGDDDHSHSELAWRLRHLPRTVLRDLGLGGRFGGREWLPLDERAPGPAFAMPSLSAQVNLLTTASLHGPSHPATSTELPHGIADVLVGASVLDGEWSLRAAVAPVIGSAWTFASEYVGNADRAHQISAGMSYSAEGVSAAPDVTVSADTPASRRAGGVYGRDRWRAAPGFVVSYGMRVDHFDYLDAPALASGDVDVAAPVTRQVSITGAAAHMIIAPGAEGFVAPAAAGPWLPPERTFSTFMAGAPLVPERVDRFELGLARELGADRRLSASWFSESSADQMATAFGLDAASDAGRYDVATVGDAMVTGWSLRFSGALARQVHGSVEYVSAAARWQPPVASDLLAGLPSSLRRTDERVHDVQGVLDAVVSRTGTHMRFAYRLDGAFTTSRAPDGAPAFGGRFSLEVRQALPFRPGRAGTVNMLMSVRNLLREVGTAGPLYDELLTLSPPLRITAGVQMGF